MISDMALRTAEDPNDLRNRNVVHPIGKGDIGDLETPINSSGLTKIFLNNLPAYRAGISVFRRGLEVGMAHGYWLIGPFAALGPFRDTAIANLAAFLSTIGLLLVSTFMISLYGNSNPPAPILDTTTSPRPPAALSTSEGWNEYGGGFLIGGVGGASIAYFLLENLGAIQQLFNVGSL